MKTNNTDKTDSTDIRTIDGHTFDLMQLEEWERQLVRAYDGDEVDTFEEDLFDSYEELINDSEEPITIFGVEYGAGEVWREMDPVAFRIGSYEDLGFRVQDILYEVEEVEIIEA